MKAAILGANGYTGLVLTRLLLQHPDIDSVVASSRSLTGTAIADYDHGLAPQALAKKCRETHGRYIAPEDVPSHSPDVVFSALPHLASADFCAAYQNKCPVIDLSADFRLRSDERFAASYGQNRPHPELQDKAVYGLTEWYRDEISKADLIASPGCYPTSVLLPLIPILAQGLAGGTITANAMSGITGAGKKAQTNLLFAERCENMGAYLPGRSHRHWNEMSQEIEAFSQGAAPKLLFTPHLIPAKQGMLATISLELSDKKITQDELFALLTNAYESSPLVTVLPPGTLPQTKAVRGTGRCLIGLQLEGDHLLLFSAIDNLYKGAASQALQAMNIRFGFQETAGIPVFGEI
ncbi:MAG: N-acetyl-gamma-glutamyl-phosphate reductase [Spirochaetaceae bacterium]|nr:MAG: N-acetyl-gamma-glutamyl-phosphate reductase [Spirochaetaceae bacterium]